MSDSSNYTYSLPQIVFLIGGLGLTGLAIGLAFHYSGPGCGQLILGKYSLPYFVGLIGMLISGGLCIWIGFSPSISQIIKWVKIGAVIVGVLLLTAGGVEVYLRIAERQIEAEEEGQVKYFSGHAPDSEFPHRSIAGEFEHTFVTDDLGFIMRDGEPNHPVPDAHRILMIGNSLLEGLQVSAEANMSERIEEQLTGELEEDVQVINIGIGSAHPVIYLESYEKYNEYFDPEIVVVVFYPQRDLSEPARARLTDSETAQKLAPQEGLRVMDFLKKKGMYQICQELEKRSPSNLPAKIPDWDPCIGLDNDLLPQCNNYTLRGISLIRNNTTAIYKDEYTTLDEHDIQIALEPISQIAALARQNNQQFVLIILPQKVQIPNQPGPSQVLGIEDETLLDSTKPQDLMLEFCQDNDLECINILPAMREDPDQAYFWKYDFHLTEAGHQLTADEAVPVLLSMLTAQGE